LTRTSIALLSIGALGCVLVMGCHSSKKSDNVKRAIRTEDAAIVLADPLPSSSGRTIEVAQDGGFADSIHRISITVIAEDGRNQQLAMQLIDATIRRMAATSVDLDRRRHGPSAGLLELRMHPGSDATTIERRIGRVSKDLEELLPHVLRSTDAWGQASQVGPIRVTVQYR
jgi:hypothetical protein